MIEKSRRILTKVIILTGRRFIKNKKEFNVGTADHYPSNEASSQVRHLDKLQKLLKLKLPLKCFV